MSQFCEGDFEFEKFESALHFLSKKRVALFTCTRVGISTRRNHNCCSIHRIF